MIESQDRRTPLFTARPTAPNLLSLFENTPHPSEEPLRALITLSTAFFTSLGLAAAQDIDIPYERFELDNGLTVIVHEDRKAPIVGVSVWYKVGARDEPEGQTGFAHLFEHLMFEGSENVENWDKPLIEAGAVGINGTTNPDRTNYLQTVPRGAAQPQTVFFLNVIPSRRSQYQIVVSCTFSPRSSASRSAIS